MVEGLWNGDSQIETRSGTYLKVKKIIILTRFELWLNLGIYLHHLSTNLDVNAPYII